MIDRIFMKKTRRGQLLKIVREHYLRDDLSCGSELCTNLACSGQTSTQKPMPLQAKPESKSTLFKIPHYIVPDTNIILHQVKCRNNIFMKFELFFFDVRFNY